MIEFEAEFHNVDHLEKSVFPDSSRKSWGSPRITTDSFVPGLPRGAKSGL